MRLASSRSVYRQYAPRIERLEDRLQPGEALMGLLLTWPEQGIAAPEQESLEAMSIFAVDNEDKVGQANESSIRLAHSLDGGIAINHVRARPTQTTVDESHPRQFLTTSPRGPAVVAAVVNAHAVYSAAATRQMTSAISPRGQAPTDVGHPGSAVSQFQTDASEPLNESAFGRLPLSFEENVGQVDSRVDFLTHTGGYTAFLTPTAAVFAIQNSEPALASVEPLGRRDHAAHVGLTPRRSPTNTAGVAIHMQIVGANPDAVADGVSPLDGKVNYFFGNDPSQWHTNISTFGAVQYDDVYPGIDLAYYGMEQQLEYDFIVSPGANPGAIALSFAGADGAEINPQGDLVLHTSAGDLVQQKPYLYQEVNGTRREVDGEFRIQNSESNTHHSSLVTFDIGAYDTTRPLVIDPVVMGYSTYLGGPSTGPGDIGWDIAVDTAGNTYVTGETTAVDFPTVPGAFDTTHNGLADVFVTKLNANGTGLVYSTYIGGSDFDVGRGIAVDANGNAYLTGNTRSSNFPTTPGALDTTVDNTDVFVTKLNPSGSALSYSTVLGGSGSDGGYAIAFDGAGNAYVCGYTQSADFPTTPGAYDTTWSFIQDAFVTKLNSDGAALAYSTFLGGGSGDEWGYGIAVNGAGEAHVTGYTSSFFFPTTPGAFDTTSNGNDAFVTKFNSSGSALAYSTFLGAMGGNSSGEGVVVDGAGNAYVSGHTSATNFPVTVGPVHGGGSDAFVTKLNLSGTGLAYSRFVGGADQDFGNDIAIDSSGNAYITGETLSTNFPTTSDAFDNTFNGSITDAFVSKLSADGTALTYSTYLGGTDQERGLGIAVDAGKNIYTTGETRSTNFPMTPGAFDTTKTWSGDYDAYVTKFKQTPTVGNVVLTPNARP